MKFEIGMATSPGMKRNGVNQDYLGIFRQGWFNRRPAMIAVADGMGGYKGGEIASREVIQTMIQVYRSSDVRQGFPTILNDCLSKAHRRIKFLANKNKQLAEMGSTIVAAVLNQSNITMLNVGDSRAYHIKKEGLILQVSQDQSLVGELVRKGELSAAEALKHPDRSRLNMSIRSARTEILPYVTEFSIDIEDSLLLCSDGLWAVVPEEEILYYVLNFPPQEAANDLIQQANEYGGPDNISVIIARCTEKGHTPKKTAEEEPDDRIIEKLSSMKQQET